MLFKDYKIGIVVGRVGLTESQLAVVRQRLTQVANYIEDGGRIELYVPGWDVEDPEGSIPPEVANLQYKDKVQVCFLGLRSHEGGAAEAIRVELELTRRCDEIWCCPGFAHGGRSQARVAQVYALGQAGARARVYKRIAHWVEMPDAVAPKKGKPKPKAKAKKHQRKERKKELLW